MDSLRQRAWQRLSHAFPERQIYIRSEGQVQFFTFSSRMQGILAGASVFVLGWIAFASVNVIFKDGILEAKERHFQQMLASYETRIGDLQLSYDELNGSLVLAQDRFKTIADSLEAKQRTLASVIEHKNQLQASLGIEAASSAASAAGAKSVRVNKPLPSNKVGGMGGVFEAGQPNANDIAPPFSVAQPPAPVAASPAPAGSSHTTQRSTFLGGAVSKLGSLFHRKVSTNELNHPIVKEANAQSARIVRLEIGESTLLAEATQDVNKETARLARVLKGTGINTVTLTKRVVAAQGTAAQPFEFATDATDDAFGAGVNDAAAAMGKLHDVVAALKAIPLISPTQVGSVSSGFGERVDPFNEQLAFHSGVDFSGPKGSDVRVTAPGIVVFAGPRGDYGNTVEVDHGNGVRTRYGHLWKIVAQVGSPVERGAIVGRLGSTGRSTGPHVHYEVWYDDAARDPGRFIKAGHDVFKE
jgi:murein DD-endopeptidase MepM/ murein hydrolase activator NlpD